MRYVVAVTVTVTSLLLGGGCGSSSKPNGDGPEEGPFNARYNAAMAMTPGERMSALAKVSEDAAEAGDAGTVKKCLAAIVPSYRDDAAQKAALSLARAGKVDAATEVAKSIIDGGTRNKVLGQLARGEYGK